MIVLAALTAVPLTSHTASGAETAPGAAADTGAIEEIIVTSRKRVENLQDVPLSVAAVTAAQARNLGAENLVDLSRNVAGLTIADLGPGQSTVAIRGISSGQVVRDESSRKETVGIYLDDSTISAALFTPDIDLFDLSRVEVLRGPQGTLFGSGAEGGVIRYITNQPDLNDTHAAFEGSVATIKHGNESYSAKAAANIPLVDGKVAARAVVYYDHMGGFIDAIKPDGTIQKHVNDGKKYGGRLAFTFKPNDNLTFTPRVVYQKLDTNGFPRGDVLNLFRNPYTTTRPAGTFDGLQQYRQTPEGMVDDFVLVDGKLDYDFGPAVLTSVTSYTDRKLHVYRDTAQLAGQIDEVLIGIPGSATMDAPLDDHTTLKVFTEELRLTSNNTGPFKWMVGGFYTHQKKTYGQILDVPGFAALFNQITDAGLTGAAANPVTNNPDNLFVSHFDITHRQFALFGEGSYDLTDKLTATAGLRWYDFKEDRDAVQSGFYQCGNSLTDCATDPSLRQRQTTSNGVSPRAILSYKATSEVTLNAQVSKGFRLGGINDPLITGICQNDIAALHGADIEKFGGESVWNYEMGFKSTLAGGKVVFNASAYYVDIKNLQVSVRLPCSSTIIVNVPKARSVGLEAELTARPTDWASFNVTANYNDATVRGDGVALVNIQPGMRLPTSPKFQAAANATFTHPVDDKLTAYLTLTAQHVGSSYSFLLDQANNSTLPFNVRYGNPAGSPVGVAFPTELSAYNIGNIRLGLKSVEKWDMALFVNNVWDERAELALDRERGGEGRVSYLRNQPRTIGVMLHSEF